MLTVYAQAHGHALESAAVYFFSATYIKTVSWIYLEGGEHRDFPPLRLIPLPRISKVYTENSTGTCLISPPQEPATDNPVSTPAVLLQQYVQFSESSVGRINLYHKFFIAPYITMHEPLERINKNCINSSRGCFDRFTIFFLSTCHFTVILSMFFITFSTT